MLFMKIGIGLSRERDPERAALQAVKDAKKAVPKPDLALAFGSIHHDQRKVHKGLCAGLDPNILFGGSSYAEITNAGVSKNSVAVLLVSFKNARIYLRGIKRQPEPRLTGRVLAQAFSEWKAHGNSLPIGILLTNFAAGKENELLSALREHLSGVPVFGGMSCGHYDKGNLHPDFWTTHQYSGDALTTESVRMALLDLPKKDCRAGFGFGHGWDPVGPAVQLTRCCGNKVYEVDKLPVLDFYRQFISREESEEFFERDVQKYAFSMMLEESGSERSVLKLPVAFDPKEGSVTYLPFEDLQGRKVRMILSSRRGAVRGAREAAQSCIASLDGFKPRLVLIVSCCTRNAILHSKMQDEVDAIRQVFGTKVPMFGYYSGGEIVPFLSRYEDVLDSSLPDSGFRYHGGTVGILAIGAKTAAKALRVPCSKDFKPDAEEEVSRLRDMLVKSEKVLDDTESFLANLSRKSYQDSKKIRKQNEIIHRYTPHNVWKQVSDHIARGKYELTDAEFMGCFMFMDVKGFTSFSEGHSSKEVVTALNEIFGPATEVIYACDGDVDKYIGDCIFAAFNTPDDALKAAKEILNLFQELKARGNPFSVRIGINSGRAVRANVGAQNRREYTYIGDAVNTTQRLEANCTPGKLLISEEVHKQGTIEFSEFERKEISVKGKKQALVVYECTL
ncbi:FIST N-terminal domain-containing protein [Elusimicrobiota bacterium]